MCQSISSAFASWSISANDGHFSSEAICGSGTAHDAPGAGPGVVGGGAEDDELGEGAELQGSGIAHDCWDIVKKREREASEASSAKLAEARAHCSPKVTPTRAAQAAAPALGNRGAPGIQRDADSDVEATKATGSL
jgi:hypothetical protein